MLTGRLTALRAIEPEDLETLRSWRNSPSLRVYFREYRELSSSDQRAWYEALRGDERTAMFSVVLVDAPNDLVGAAGLCDIDWRRRTAEMSLYIGDGYVDSRLAPDAAETLLGFAFRDLDLHRVSVETYDFDDAKDRLCRDLGFRYEGRLREAHYIGRRRFDVQVFGLLAHEFRR